MQSSTFDTSNNRGPNAAYGGSAPYAQHTQRPPESRFPVITNRNFACFKTVERVVKRIFEDADGSSAAGAEKDFFTVTPLPFGALSGANRVQLNPGVFYFFPMVIVGHVGATGKVNFSKARVYHSTGTPVGDASIQVGVYQLTAGNFYDKTTYSGGNLNRIAQSQNVATLDGTTNRGYFVEFDFGTVTTLEAATGGENRFFFAIEVKDAPGGTNHFLGSVASTRTPYYNTMQGLTAPYATAPTDMPAALVAQTVIPTNIPMVYYSLYT